MKTTTKIVLGIILSIFILAIGFIVGFSFTDRKYHRYNKYLVEISQENRKNIQVDAYKTIVLAMEPEQHDFCLYFGGELNLLPANDNGANNLSFPEELDGFFTADIVNDTLFIKIQTDKLCAKFDSIKHIELHRSITGIVFEATTNQIDVINGAFGINTNVKDVKTDKIKITTISDIYIENCKTDVLEPIMKIDHKIIKLKDSQVKKLNIDLDNMSQWSVENCEIEEENLTGSRRHESHFSKSEAKIMNWLPKNKDAQLSVTLSGDTTRIVFP